MLPGINTDVTHEGVAYHVQTEDLGAKNRIILTLAYRSGAVVLREMLDYGGTLAPSAPASLLKSLMEAQHRRVLRQVADGDLERSGLPAGAPASPTPSKSVDDLIEDYLCLRRRGAAGSAPPRKPE